MRGYGLQGYFAHKEHPPPPDHHRSLGIGLLYGPEGGVLLMSEVPLFGLCFGSRGFHGFGVGYWAGPRALRQDVSACRGTSLIKNNPPP